VLGIERPLGPILGAGVDWKKEHQGCHQTQAATTVSRLPKGLHLFFSCRAEVNVDGPHGLTSHTAKA